MVIRFVPNASRANSAVNMASFAEKHPAVFGRIKRPFLWTWSYKFPCELCTETRRKDMVFHRCSTRFNTVKHRLSIWIEKH